MSFINLGTLTNEKNNCKVAFFKEENRKKAVRIFTDLLSHPSLKTLLGEQIILKRTVGENYDYVEVSSKGFIKFTTRIYDPSIADRAKIVHIFVDEQSVSSLVSDFDLSYEDVLMLKKRFDDLL